MDRGRPPLGRLITVRAAHRAAVLLAASTLVLVPAGLAIPV